MSSPDDLRRSFEAVGLAAWSLGERIVVLPFGGRVIGVFPRPDVNALWTNALVLDRAKFAPLLTRPDWLNIGGDRTWISPEVETNVGDPGRMLATYSVPKPIDPGAHHVTGRRADSITLVNHLVVPFLRTSRNVELTVTKQVRQLDRPPTAFGKLKDVVGYELRTRLESESLPAGTHPAIWNLLQVPGGGVIHVRSRAAMEPRAFFGAPKWARRGESVTVPVRGAVSSKLGLHASQSYGEMFYTGRAGGAHYLLMRRFRISPADQYYDVPCDDLSARGYMTQVYVDDGALGGFGEMEYHSPGLDRTAGGAVIEDVCETWTCAGDANEIEGVAKAIAG